MKAIYLLLCVTLARDISGSIFQRRRHPEMNRYYVDQFQPQYFQNHHREVDQDQEYQKQPRNQNREVFYGQSQEQQQQQQLQQEPQQQYKQLQYKQEPYKQQQYMQQQYKQEQYKQLPYMKRQETQGPVINRFADSDSNSKESSSLENNLVEQLNLPGGDLYALPMFADMNDPATVLLKSARINDQARFGDAVAWRGIQLAAAADAEESVSEKDIKKIYKEAQKAMQHIDPETKTMIHKALENAAAESNNEDAHLNATQLLKKYQYPVEEHSIKTEDGYILTLFRIPPRQQANDIKEKPVVFLMHGLLGSADDWLLMGPKKSLAYLLSNAGYDVWLGNARGSKYSHHASKHRAQDDFWQYSNDEIALFDLPKMIDYALQTSNQEKMYYIGHSLGTTAFFALAAARPAYNEKIVMMYALSPMAYMSNARSPMVRMIAPTSELHERLHQQLGHGEFKPSKEVVNTLGGAMCENEIGCKHLCSNAYIVMVGVNVNNLNTSKIPTILSHLPAGGSTKQMKQYGQALASHDFRMYDYGAQVNQKVYGETLPPKYDMKAVTAPVALYFSKQDWLAHPKDVKKLQQELPNVTDTYMVPEEYFSHMDFQFSKQAPEVVYKRLIASIQQKNTY